jgi:hypothetical protein
MEPCLFQGLLDADLKPDNVTSFLTEAAGNPDEGEVTMWPRAVPNQDRTRSTMVTVTTLMY